jgi:hypothetical protein
MDHRARYGLSRAVEILPGLWLGSFVDAQDAKYKGIMNCTKDIPFPPRHAGRAVRRVAVDDDLSATEIGRMGARLPSAVRELDGLCRTKPCVLVHCFAGVQRSPCVVCAYLMWKFELTLRQAVRVLKTLKPDVFSPSMNFYRALKTFEDGLRARR